MTVRTQTQSWWLGRRRSKDDRKPNTLATLLWSITRYAKLMQNRKLTNAQSSRNVKFLFVKIFTFAYSMNTQNTRN
jgi:hypothetical protein